MTAPPGELWALAAVFNVHPDTLPSKNFSVFADRLRRQRVPLLVVELAFDDAPFALSAGDCDRLHQIRSTTWLWQKERLLNIGLAHLPASCDRVAWLDADVFFENDSWAEQTSALLDEWPIVQPFETACWLPPDVSTPLRQSCFSFGNGEGQSMKGMGATLAEASDPAAALSNYFTHGHCGFGWAARRSLLERHGFYDRNILGEGDLAMAYAYYGHAEYWEGRTHTSKRFPQALRADLASWSEALYQDVRSEVAFTPGRIFHLWHGSVDNRRYVERIDLLADSGFDPATDITLDRAGCWSWNSDKPDFHQAVRDYFAQRNC